MGDGVFNHLFPYLFESVVIGFVQLFNIGQFAFLEYRNSMTTFYPLLNVQAAFKHGYQRDLEGILGTFETANQQLAHETCQVALTSEEQVVL